MFTYGYTSSIFHPLVEEFPISCTGTRVPHFMPGCKSSHFMHWCKSSSFHVQVQEFPISCPGARVHHFMHGYRSSSFHTRVQEFLFHARVQEFPFRARVQEFSISCTGSRVRHFTHPFPHFMHGYTMQIHIEPHTKLNLRISHCEGNEDLITDFWWTSIRITVCPFPLSSVYRVSLTHSINWNC